MKKLNKKESVRLFKIGHEMAKCGLDHQFIITAIKLANNFEGIKGQIFLWAEETNPDERDAIIKDIQDGIEILLDFEIK